MSEDIAARLIAELANEGELVDGGGFSIDPEAARRKLADRQLSEPDAWLLLVMEAAELAGVARVVIRERPLGFVVEMHGEAAPELAPAAEIEELFTWVFVDLGALAPDERARGRARQLLALGVNAALAGATRSVALASIRPEGGRRMVLQPEEGNRIGPIEGGAAQLELRFAGALVAESDSFGRAELARVAERCGWGRVQIEIVGREVERRPPPAPVLSARELLGPERGLVGRAEIVQSGAQPVATLVANGVALESIPLPGWAVGFRAVIHEGGFERDLSLGKAIRSPAFDALFGQLRSHHDAMVAQLQRAGTRVAYSSAAPAVVSSKDTRSLGAMVNDPGNSWGHNAAWATFGLVMVAGWSAMTGAWIPAVVAGGLSVASGGAAAYFLRLRRVFGDEG